MSRLISVPVIVLFVLMSQTVAQDSSRHRSTVSFTAGVCNLSSVTVASASSTDQASHLFETNPGVSLAAAFDLNLDRAWSIGLTLETSRLVQQNFTGDARYYNLFSLVLKTILGGGPNGFRPGIGLGRAEFGDIGYDERVHWWASRLSLELIHRPLLLEMMTSLKIGGGGQHYSVTSDPAFVIRAGILF